MSLRDLYSNLGFFVAFASDTTGDAAGQTLPSAYVDMQGYGAATIAINIASYCSAGANGAGDYVVFYLQHGLASAAGVSAWSTVPASLIIHSVDGGYDSTDSVAYFLSLASASEIAASGNSAVYFVGYKGDNLHRYLRLVYSNVGAASAMDMGAIAILGEPANWPVNTPL